MLGLSNMVTPKIEREAESRNYGKFVIGPLERGYGITLGNALRRVLLSSLDGAAVTSIRVVDVQHEFSEIPGVREDVIRVMLQIKQLRVRIFDVDTARMHIEITGSGVVTAADIIAPPEVEVVNPDLYLFTSDSAKTKLELEMTVERGRGYSPAQDRSGKLPIGELPVDAIFTSVKQVNWEEKPAKVSMIIIGDHSMTYKNILVEKKENIGIIKINRPQVLNALNKDTINELSQAVDELEQDKSIKVAILTGEGKAFIAGADIKQMSQMSSLEGKEFAEIGLQIKNGLGGNVMVLGYSNNSEVGYIPTAEQFPLGGYEVTGAPQYYGLFPWSPDIENYIVTEAIELINNM